MPIEAECAPDLLPGVAPLPLDPDWWRGAVIYQIYPRSFQDSDGDGVGDLAGIAQRLPHIAALGADAIWISPFFTSPMKDFGYDVSDYCNVDPMFGTLADFDRVVARAHELGLRVMIDLVLSHTADVHPWFLESRASRTTRGRLVRLGRPQAGRHAAQQLAVGLRRLRLGLASGARAVLPA
jgi:alpha-glucosidase